MRTKRITLELPYTMPLMLLGTLAKMIGCSVQRVDTRQGAIYKFRPREGQQA